MHVAHLENVCAAEKVSQQLWEQLTSFLASVTFSGPGRGGHSRIVKECSGDPLTLFYALRLLPCRSPAKSPHPRGGFVDPRFRYLSSPNLETY